MPVVDIEVDTRSTLYEHDTVYKLTHTIKQVLQSYSNPIRVSLNLPQVEYYLYLLEAYNHGFISADLLLKWFSIVDVRYAKNLFLYQSAMQAVMQGYAFYTVEPLSFIKPYIMNLVKQRKKVAFSDILVWVSKSKTLYGDIVLKVTGTPFEPKTFMELADLSYVVALMTDDLCTSNHLTLMVDNPQEAKIYSRMKQISGCLQHSPNIVGLYPKSKIVQYDQSGSIHNLFWSNLTLDDCPSDLMAHFKCHYDELEFDCLVK